MTANVDDLVDNLFDHLDRCTGGSPFHHLDRYKDNPSFQNVLVGDATFKNEIEKTYGIWNLDVIRIGNREMSTGYAVLRESRSDECPKDLVDMLERFSPRPFDRAKLAPDRVRADYHLRISNEKKSFRKGLLYGGLAVAATFAAATLDNAVGCATLPAVYVLAGAGFAVAKRQGEESGGEIGEFLRLLRAGEAADDFMGTSYRKDWISRRLDTIPPEARTPKPCLPPSERL